MTVTERSKTKSENTEFSNTRKSFTDQAEAGIKEQPSLTQLRQINSLSSHK